MRCVSGKNSRERVGALHLEFLAMSSCYVIAKGYRLVRPYLHTSVVRVKQNEANAIEVRSKSWLIF